MPDIVAIAITSRINTTVFLAPITDLITSILGSDNAGPAKRSARAGPLLIPAPIRPCRMGTSVSVAKYINAPAIAANRFARIRANLFAAIAGAFMYFATLTEVPILQGLMGAGMSKGPALALLLAGPALSLPSMLVIRSVMGAKKTVVFILLVIAMATISGTIFGALF